MFAWVCFFFYIMSVVVTDIVALGLIFILLRARSKRNLISHLINPLTARVVWASQMISQPVSSTFPVLHCPLGLGELWACPFPNAVFPPLFLSALSSSLSLWLARWVWPDLMNGKHDHTTAVCISLWSSDLHGSNCLLDLGTDFLVGNMVFVWDA